MKQRSTITLKGPMADGFIKFLTEKSPAESSGVAQPCPPSANGCPEARADGRPGADSSVRCPEVNGLGKLEAILRAANDTSKDAQQKIVELWLSGESNEAALILAAYKIGLNEGKSRAQSQSVQGPDAGQCNGQRVLPDNATSVPPERSAPDA